MGLYFIIVLFFCLYICFLESKYSNAFKENESKYIIKIISIKADGNYVDKYIGKILYGKNKNFRVNMYVSKDNSFKYGDILEITGEIELPSKARNSKGFDYSIYLKTQKIAASIFVKNSQFIKREENFISKIYDVKLKCINILNKNFGLQEAELLRAILLGDKSGITDETEEIFSKSNLSHILAISGLHVTYVIVYLDKILDKILNNIKLKYICIIIFLILFMIFVGSSPSSLRAGIMMIFYYIGKIFLRERDFYTSFLISLVVILFINPYNIYSISMWLSFLGSLGIVLFSDFFQKVISKKLRLKNKFCKKFLETILVSISAQILIFPIMWKNFGTISINFWISNLLVSELVAPIIVIRLYEHIIISIKKFHSVYRKHIIESVF